MKDRIIIRIKQQRYANLRRSIARKIISKTTVRDLLKDKNKEVVIVAGDPYIPIEQLSTSIRNKFDELIKAAEQDEKKYEDSDKTNEIMLILCLAYNSGLLYKKFLVYFDQPFLLSQERELYARTAAFVDSIIGLKREGYKLTEIFSACVSLKKQLINLRFPIRNYDYFTSKLKECEEVGISQSIFNAKRNEQYLQRKFTRFHQKYAINFYKDSRRFKYRKIVELINSEVIKLGLKPIDLSTLKKFLAQPCIQNTYKSFRLGRKWAEENLYPYLVRKKPRKVNYKWEIDATCLNFYVVDADGNVGRRWLCILIDVKSRKIISYTVGMYETTDMIIKTLMKAILKYHIIPFELVHDNSSALRSKRVQEIETKMEELGSYIRLCEPDHPQDKGTVENTIGLMQDFFRTQKGYLGDGPRSFKEEGRVDPKLKQEYFTGKKEGLWTEHDLILMVDTAINNFNNSIL
jgi:hypothetical protein